MYPGDEPEAIEMVELAVEYVYGDCLRTAPRDRTHPTDGNAALGVRRWQRPDVLATAGLDGARAFTEHGRYPQRRQPLLPRRWEPTAAIHGGPTSMGPFFSYSRNASFTTLLQRRSPTVV